MAEQTANHLDVGAVPPPSFWLRVWDSDVFYSFRSSKVAMVAALATAIIIFLAIFAPLVAPH